MQVFDLLLSPNRDDPDFMLKAKSLWFSKRDPIEILKMLPPDMGKYQNSIENWLFKGLAEHYNGGRGDLKKAFNTIPQMFRIMSYSSFKSFLWNHLVSFRLHTFGRKPIPGDVVHLENSKDGDDNEEDENCPKLFTHKVKVLTENDFDSNGNCRDYSIYDVLLASPGSRMTKYANPIIQNHFEMLLKANDLDVNCFSKFSEK